MNETIAKYWGTFKWTKYSVKAYKYIDSNKEQRYTLQAINKMHFHTCVSKSALSI